MVVEDVARCVKMALHGGTIAGAVLPAVVIGVAKVRVASVVVDLTLGIFTSFQGINCL